MFFLLILNKFKFEQAAKIFFWAANKFFLGLTKVLVHQQKKIMLLIAHTQVVL